MFIRVDGRNVSGPEDLPTTIRIEKKEATKKSYYGAEYPISLRYINKSVWWFEIIGLITIYLASIL